MSFMSLNQQVPLNQQVAWHDLTEHTLIDTIKEMSLPLAWLTFSLIAINFSFLLAIICVSYTFLYALRVAHNAFHRALGMPVRAYNWVMLVMSWILIGSVHAVSVTHMYHHDHCLEGDDVEGQLAHHSFWKALMLSPIYPFRVHIQAFKIASLENRRWIILELVSSATIHLFMLPTLLGVNYSLYLAVMILANLFSPMFSTWLVHRDCDNASSQARSCRSAIVNFLTGNMFYHHEHHLFPAVPSRRMPELGARIDRHTKENGLMIY